MTEEITLLQWENEELRRLLEYAWQELYFQNLDVYEQIYQETYGRDEEDVRWYDDVDRVLHR
ncbi:MAG TPA: hypothetical protein VMX17_02685 [Candidatus Glassbacteria bacterium]|nr:hypothetical protein [Candidatus Glassbacteria bacterium]